MRTISFHVMLDFIFAHDRRRCVQHGAQLCRSPSSRSFGRHVVCSGRRSRNRASCRFGDRHRDPDAAFNLLVFKRVTNGTEAAADSEPVIVLAASAGQPDC